MIVATEAAKQGVTVGEGTVSGLCEGIRVLGW